MDIKEILRLASTAPSGDNCQPWQIEATGNMLAVFNRPDRDSSLYNSRQRASLIAIGAFIENIKIACGKFHTEAKITYFPNQSNQNHIANIVLENSEEQSDSDLLPFLERRHTNRRPYSSKPLQMEQKMELINSVKNDFGIQLHITDDEMNKKKIADSTSMNEFLVLTVKQLHNFLFAHIRWNSEQVNETKNGFDLQTLEMNRFQKVVFRLASKWPLMRIFQKIGLPMLIAKENSKIYFQSQAFGALVGAAQDPKNWLNCGQVLQRLWLTATKLGLSIHPLTGIIFLKYRINDGVSELSPGNVAIIEKNYDKVFNAFNLQTGNLMFLFRIGAASEPTAVSRRFEIKQIANLS